MTTSRHKKPRAPRLGLQLDYWSSLIADSFLHRLKQEGLNSFNLYRETLTLHNDTCAIPTISGRDRLPRYELGLKRTGRNYSVWAYLIGEDDEALLLRKFEVKRKVDANHAQSEQPDALTIKRLKRALERCLLDIRNEAQRRRVVTRVYFRAELVGLNKPWFAEMVELEEGRLGRSFFDTMSKVRGIMWLNWLSRVFAGAAPLPPSRQLGPEQSYFCVHAGPILVYEGDHAFYITHRALGETRCMGDGVDWQFNAGPSDHPSAAFPIGPFTVCSPEFYEALSRDVAHNWREFENAYFGNVLEDERQAPPSGECSECGADIAPADIEKPCWDCGAGPTKGPGTPASHTGKTEVF